MKYKIKNNSDFEKTLEIHIDIKDLTSFEFIRSNQVIILEYKNENFLFLSIAFFIFSVVWTLLLGFATPILLFSGFVFGKWWGILIVLAATTLGATLLYLLAGLFFRDVIEEKLALLHGSMLSISQPNQVRYSQKNQNNLFRVVRLV